MEWMKYKLHLEKNTKQLLIKYTNKEADSKVKGQPPSLLKDISLLVYLSLAPLI